MVESGQPPIVPVDFASRRHADLPVEVLDRAEIIRRVGADWLARPERPSFHELILVRSGSGAHTVDFEPIEAVPCRLIWLRPGQVQAWHPHDDFEAWLILSRPAVASAAPWFPGDRAYRDLDPPAFDLAEALVGGIRREQDGYVGARAEDRLLIALFEGLTALFDRAGSSRYETRLPVAYVAFRDAVEADLSASHDVTDYAARLGYSARTLSRACQLAAGQTAKEVLTDRLALEAKRLLVHTDLPASAIATELGFSEATNFGKFFGRATGLTPGAFRAAQG